MALPSSVVFVSGSEGFTAESGCGPVGGCLPLHRTVELVNRGSKTKPGRKKKTEVQLSLLPFPPLSLLPPLGQTGAVFSESNDRPTHKQEPAANSSASARRATAFKPGDDVEDEPNSPWPSGSENVSEFE